MIMDAVVEAGTVLHFDFDALGGAWPEMEGARPAIVLTPVGRQKNRTVIVVPISSKIANEANPSAVEIGHKGLKAASPTGRAFAICNLPVALSLDRSELDYYRVGRPLSGNRQALYQVQGEDLEVVRALVMEQLWTNRQFRALVGHARLYEMLRTRQQAAHRKAQTSRRKPTRRRRLIPGEEGADLDAAATAVVKMRSKPGPRRSGRAGKVLSRTRGPRPRPPRPRVHDGM